MYPPSYKHENSHNLETPILKDFLDLPVDSRSAHIQQYGLVDLTATLQRLRSEGVSIPNKMESRLAWAIACNLEGVSASEGKSPPASHRGIRSYKDKWPIVARFSELWAILTRTTLLPNPGHQTALLDELALSVLCEQKSEWQDPLSRPVDVESANHAFEFVYAKNKAKVLGDIRKTFGERADNPDAIADEAWARVFCDYWSAGARRRFLGLCRISTLVAQVARFVAIDLIRDKGAFVMDEGSAGDSDNEHKGFSLDRIGVFFDPTEQIAGKQLEQKIHECIDGLPPKQKIVVEMVWVQEMSAKESAERLHISEPAVSQHLKKARETLRSHLKVHGFDVSA